MRGLRSFLILVVVAAGLFSYIYFVESKKSGTEATPEKPKVFTVESDTIQSIEVRSDKGDRTKLRSVDGKWEIVEPAAAPVDDNEVTAIRSGLSGLQLQRVVDEKPADVAPYGLKPPRFEVAFQAAGSTETERLLCGIKTPTGGDLYAQVAGQDRVFLISSYLESTFNRTTFDLRDKRLLTFDRSKVDAVEIDASGQTVRFTKAGTDWMIAAPIQARADYSLVEGLIGRVENARMAAIVATENADLKSYGLDKPGVTIRFGMGSSQAALECGKLLDDKDRVYARDVSRPLVFAVQKSLTDEVAGKTAADYRRKDLFDFRAFSATRAEFVRGGKTYVFEKTKAADGTEKWAATAPTKYEPDGAKVDAALSAFANLRAQSFVDSTRGTGLETPAVTISAEYADGDTKKTERAAFGQAKDGAFASTPGQPGALKLDAKDLDNALKALDEIVKS